MYVASQNYSYKSKNAIEFVRSQYHIVRFIYNNINNTFVERHSAGSFRGAGGTGKLAICNIEQVSF